MNYLRNPLSLISVLSAIAVCVFVLTWQGTKSTSYADLRIVLETTTATFGTLLGIITAGLMFTQGRFSELASELSDRAPHYATEILSLEKLESISTQLSALRKNFSQLALSATVAEEKSLYSKISANASSMFIGLAVLLNLKLKQQGLPESGLLVSEMDAGIFRAYQKRMRSIKKDWQVLDLIERITETWQAPAMFSGEGPKAELGLEADLRSAISVLRLRENVEKGSTGMSNEITKTQSRLDAEIDRIKRRLHEDRIPQLLPQMKQAAVLRGGYFYLALVFIAAPLLINLLIFPQLSEATVNLFQPAIAVTSLLSVMGVVFLLLYIQKILSV